jgi:hypothetical protein
MNIRDRTPPPAQVQDTGTFTHRFDDPGTYVLLAAALVLAAQLPSRTRPRS